MQYESKVRSGDILRLIEEAETHEDVVYGKVLNVTYKLKNGFTIVASGSCVDPNNFDVEIGRSVAKQNAIDKLWELEGYVLQGLRNGFNVDYRIDDDE